MTANDRIDDFERRLRELEREFAEIRNLLAAGAREPEEPPPMIAAEPAPESEPVRERPPASPPRWFEQSHDFQASDLLGARALAWAGGIVTVLGIVLFFALAVNRGRIGPGARVVLGALASAIVFGGGLYLRRRFGETYSALSAVGAGIAGGYATLLAAGPYYDLLPDWTALAVATGIAGFALAIALRWSSELVAGLGLVGAMLVQIPIAWGHGLTTEGMAFTAFMFAAAAAVVVVRRWQTLLTVSTIATAPQVVALAGEHAGNAPAGPLAVAAASAAVLLATGIGLQLRSEAGLEALALVVRMPERLSVSRMPVFSLAGALATYAVSLVVLERFEIGGGRIETRFERGHAAVSALWGVLALLLLYLGLTRRRSLRLAGFALFGVTLAKIIYDLSTLSPVARALSFLAVGAVLLLGGFFYQRLSSETTDGPEATGR